MPPAMVAIGREVLGDRLGAFPGFLVEHETGCPLGHVVAEQNRNGTLPSLLVNPDHAPRLAGRHVR